MVKTLLLDLVHRQRGPVQRHRAFFRDEFRQIFRGLDLEMGHAVKIAPRQKSRDAIDMAGHHMAAKFVAQPERPLQIDPLALRPGARRGHGQGLGGGVHLVPADKTLLSARGPKATRVMQTPSWATEAPSSRLSCG